jgi:acyl-CoA synthetase (AMP-forming)/AMP-acid ligase II
MVPTMSRMLPRELEGDPRLASIRTVPFGGEAASRADIERALGWGAVDVRSMYFAAELGRASSTWCSHREMVAGRWGSVGRAVPNAEVRIVDPDGPIDAQLPAGSVGEIVVRGPSVAAGYWKDPQRTRRSFVDGWWRSGDLGCVDEDGYLFVRGRLDNVINTGGIKVCGEEVEQALLACPGVRQAAAIGVPDDRWGERIEAHVVAPGIDAPAIERHLAQSGALAPFKRPKRYRFHDALPSGATGKIDRLALRGAERASRAGDTG